MKANLNYAIELLETVRKKLLNLQQLTGEDQVQKVNQIEGFTRAILILNTEKIRDAQPKIGVWLTIREAKILCLRAKKKTLYEIAKMFKVTAERIRQIEAKAVRKLESGIKAQEEKKGVVDEHLFKRSKKTSNLLYPITVLEAERDNVPHQPGSLIAQLNKAIDILNDKREE
ncbi:MAG: hypothetical protein KAV87_56555 [Desulfobacteraceae bacterium]|nr:hypothetical protein [Desulfobacteraceae bacterium]